MTDIPSEEKSLSKGEVKPSHGELKAPAQGDESNAPQGEVKKKKRGYISRGWRYLWGTTTTAPVHTVVTGPITPTVSSDSEQKVSVHDQDMLNSLATIEEANTPPPKPTVSVIDRLPEPEPEQQLNEQDPKLEKLKTAEDIYGYLDKLINDVKARNEVEASIQAPAVEEAPTIDRSNQPVPLEEAVVKRKNTGLATSEDFEPTVIRERRSKKGANKRCKMTDEVNVSIDFDGNTSQLRREMLSLSNPALLSEDQSPPTVEPVPRVCGSTRPGHLQAIRMPSIPVTPIYTVEDDIVDEEPDNIQVFCGEVVDIWSSITNFFKNTTRHQ